MRVHGPGATPLATTTAPARRSGATGFAIPAETQPRQNTGASGIRTVASLDALLALQAVDDATERRKRAVKRGQAALDVLDEIKVAVLAGALEPSSLGRLKAALGGLQERSGEQGLDSVLAQIELRAEVELAKYSARPASRA